MRFDEYSYSDHPEIKMKIPGPKSKSILEKQQKLEGNAVSYPRGTPIAIASGKGATIQDMDGNIFLDFFSGAGVLSLGHCHPYVHAAIEEAAKTITHTLDFPTKYRIDLDEILQSILPGQLRNNAKIQYGGPTGSDAVEAAIKLAKLITKRFPIIAFEGGYHGMTAGANSLCSGKFWKEKYIPQIPEVHFIPYSYPYRCVFGSNTPEQSAEASARFYEHILEDPHSGVCHPAMTIIEPIQGEGGSIIPHPSFLQKIADLNRKYEIPLVIDEIQSGFGRTGKMFACEHSNTTPDIMTISKAIGGGFPLSGIVFRSDLDQMPRAGHIGTFRGNIIAMAAGSATLQYMIDEHLVQYSAEIGQFLYDKLKPLEQKRPFVGEVRGKGLMLGIEIVTDQISKRPDSVRCIQIRNELIQRGVLIEIGGHYNNVLRFLPPLILTYDQAKSGIEIISDVIQTIP